MTAPALHRLDFNLLLDLDALLREGSVVAAARTRNLSAAAMSRRLGRLREAMGDPLFVPAGRGLVPTPRAQALAERVRGAIEHVGRVFTPDVLDLKSLRRNFALRANDGFLGSWAARLTTAITSEAPGVALQFIARSDKSSDPLRSGAIDLAIGVPGPSESEIRQQPLFTACFVGVVRADHPLLSAHGRNRSNKRLTGQPAVGVHEFIAWPHVTASQRASTTGRIDEALRALGRERRIVASAPGFQAALAMVASSDCITAIPEPFVRWATSQHAVRSFALPITLPAVEVSQQWHHRHQLDPAHAWLREQVRIACADAAGPGVTRQPGRRQ